MTSGRAASWTATSSVSTSLESRRHGLRAVLAAGDGHHALAQVQPRDPAAAATITGPTLSAGANASSDHSTIGRAGERHEGLRAAGSESLSGAGGRDDR